MARPNTDSERINVYVPRKVMRVIRALAKRRQMPYSEVLRTAIRLYVIDEAKKEKENE